MEVIGLGGPRAARPARVRRMDVKRVSLVFAVALGLAAATFAGLWSSHGASAQLQEQLKCYRVRDVVSSDIGTRLIYISDQFEEKNLVIKKPIDFCSLAEKSGAGGNTAGINEPSDLVCYSFSNAPRQARFQPQEILTFDQFSESDGQVLVVTKPYSLCEPAQKGTGGSSAGFDHGLFDAFEFKCYRVRRAEHGRFEKISVRVFDQFDQGGKDVRLGAPIVFCTQVVEKKNKAKNDRIEHAVFLDPPTEYHASTIGSGRDRSDPPMSCASSYGHSVFFSYTPGSTDTHTFETSFSTYDTVMAIYEAGDPLNEIACDDDGGPTSGSSLIETELQSGTKYVIVVGAYGGSPGGKLKLNVDLPILCGAVNAQGCTTGSTAAEAGAAGTGEAAAPFTRNFLCYSLSQRTPANPVVSTGDQLSNSVLELGRGNMFCTPVVKKTFAETDDIEDAGTLTPFDEVHVSTINATSDPNDPDCGGHTYGHSVWYTYEFPGNDKSFDIDTLDSTYDTILGVYTGTPGNLQEVGCNDDDIGLTSHLSIETKAGAQTYYILVGALGDHDGGKLKLHLETQAGCAACP
jgi:hypothetical protein